MKQSVIFLHEKATKNTERFTENGPKDKQIIGTLYVQRSAFSGVIPSEITVSIEY